MCKVHSWGSGACSPEVLKICLLRLNLGVFLTEDYKTGVLSIIKLGIRSGVLAVQDSKMLIKIIM